MLCSFSTEAELLYFLDV